MNIDEELVAKRQELSILDSKIVDQSQKIIDQHHSDNVVRENLAAWQRRLEKKEQLLHDRELKVSESEGARIRNSNLLNL